MMKLFHIFCFNLTWLTLFKITAATEDQSCNNILWFGKTTGDYVKFKPNMQPFSDGFSICSWIRKLRIGPNPNWFSYSDTSRHHLEIIISDDGSINQLFRRYYINVQRQAGVTIGSWYHYCLCWDLTSRTATIYHNGTQTGSFITPAGRRLDTDGYLLLGQERAYYGDGSSPSHVFGGGLSKLNVFSKKLTSLEVKEMYSAGRCSDIEKKHDDTRHLKWEDILQQPRTGNVRVIITEQQLEQLEEELAEARKELEATKSELNNTKKDLGHKSAELDKVRAELQETTSQLTETEAKLNNTEKNLARCQANRETVEDLKDMLNTSIGEIKTEMETHAEEVAKLKEQIAGMSKGAKILAAEGGLRDEKCAEVCAGTTGRKSTSWENFGAQGLHTTVDISGCGFVTIPTVTTSLEGDWRHWKNSGGSEIYKVTTSSFQTYIHVPEKDLRHRAADLQWNMEWIAVGYTC